jgi:chemotaxis-related protein WspD
MTDRSAQPRSLLHDCWNHIGVWSKDKASCPELQRFIHCRNCAHYSASGRQMLERPVPADYRSESTARFSRVKLEQQICDNAALLFRLGDEWLALNSLLVNEITPLRTIHSLPHRDNPLVKGLVNIRGELRVCVSIGSLLHLDRARESYTTDHEILERLIFVEKDNQGFVFPVSEVHGIHHFSDAEVDSLPATLSHAKNNFTRGIITWHEQHVGILDDELLFYALMRGLQ